MSAVLTATEQTPRIIECRAVELEYRGYTKAGNPSRKFWRGVVIPSGEHRPAYFVAHYGRIGATGQTTVKAYPSTLAAENAMRDKRWEKDGKGYDPQWGGTIEFPAGLTFFAEAGRNGIFASDIDEAFDNAR